MAEEEVVLSVGDAAPAIEADATGDGHFSLGGHAGQFVVAYFFPRSNTPG